MSESRGHDPTPQDPLRQLAEPTSRVTGEPPGGSPISGSVALEKGLGATFIKVNNSFGSKTSKLLGKIGVVPGQLATFAATAVIHELLDTTLPDILGTVAATHYKTARDTLAEAMMESNKQRRHDKIVQAEGSLRDAYQFWNQQIAERAKKWWLDSAHPEIISAHRGAVETAVFLARINHALGSAPEIVSSWMEQAGHHFEAYDSLSRRGSENGVFRCKAGKGVGVAVGLVGIAASGALGAFLFAGAGLAAIEAADKRINELESLPERLAVEREAFTTLRATLAAR